MPSGPTGCRVPTEPFRVELTAPSGALWSWGPAEAAERVYRPGIDFALLVTQRRHPDDLSLIATGPLARQWITIAQAFAGAPGAGPGTQRSVNPVRTG